MLSPTTTRPHSGIRRAATVLSFALALGVTGFTTQSALGSDDPTSPSDRVNASGTDKAQATSPVNRAVSTPATRATAALTRASAQIRAHHPVRGIAALRVVRANVVRAHLAAMSQIGAPPTDPESDDPPGPPAVLAVVGLEHRMAAGVVPLFNAGARADVVQELRVVLTSVHQRRDIILNRIIALPPEGAGGDYADGMADTLGVYAAEVKQLSTALSTYHLTPAGQLGLQNGLARVRATQAKVTAAYGGGE